MVECAYTTLIFIACIYKSHSDFVHFTEFMPMIKEGKHIHCCCDTRERKFNLDGFLEYGKYLFGLVFTISCPLWERYIGRHAALLVTVLTGVFCSTLLIFSLPTDVLQLVHLMLNLCSAFTMLISMVNISEMLPYHHRFLTVAIYMFATILDDAIATLHFYLGFTLINLGAISAFGYLFGTILMICKEELRLFETNPEGDEYYHSRVARKIFEDDLFYLDRTELKLTDFLKRLWRNSVVLEIVLALFQSFSAGIHEYEFHRFMMAQFRGRYMIKIDCIVGYVAALLMLFVLRKWHRVNALVFVFTSALLTQALFHALVSYGKTNGCAGFDLIEPVFNMFSTIIGILSICWGTCMQTLIIFHFVETTPSLLRMTSLFMCSLPMKLAKYLSPYMIGDRNNNDLHSVIPVYIYHLLIIIITMAQGRVKLPFSLYLFDLMPISEKEPESEREESANEEEEIITDRQATSMVHQPYLKSFDDSGNGFDPSKTCKNC